MQNDFLFYYFYAFLEGEGREWTLIFGCEERETIKEKSINIDILMNWHIKLIIRCECFEKWLAKLEKEIP